MPNYLQIIKSTANASATKHNVQFLIAASSMQPSRGTQGLGRNHASRLLWQQEVAENK
jgi:hypothetical protein